MLSLLLTAATLAPIPALGAEDTTQTSWNIHAERVYTGTGEVLKNALIAVEDGKIASIRPGRSAPEGAIQAKAITAGMIDLSVRVHGGFRSVEQAREIQPHLSVEPAIDLYDPAWKRLAASGITTALLSPMDRNVIGGHAVVLKTAGPEELAARKVTTPRPILRGAIGSEPSSGNHPAFGTPTDFYSRRPTTRMGVEWEWRKAFFDAVNAGGDESRDFPGAEELRSCLRGERLLIIQAWATQDIRTAIYLKEEMAREGFGNLDLVIDAAAEAWREPDFLTRNKTTIILPPFPAGGRTTDGAFLAWNRTAELAGMGVRMCLSSHGASNATEKLERQGAYARRAGLTFDQTLAAVTTNPAAVLGLSDQLGTVEVGRDADLVLWSGTPFEASSRVVGVLVAGELARDPR
ncbi:MAG: amidohydrolase family protein [Planctomycetota bacterium]|nr:amidohydrolase family protein [Planctomycetota bacterium]